MNNDTNLYLETLYSRNNLSQKQSYDLFSHVLSGQLESAQITALLIALKIKGETTDEIAGAAAAMRDRAQPFERPEYAFSDLVGTGGDGHNTINISSAASIVAASCGIKVAKHGNRSVSSKSGSSDLFSGLGLNINMSADTARQCLDSANICFLAAPIYHLGMKHVMPIRLSLKTRTLFNILGPLANPAKPTHGIYGVYQEDLLPVYANTLLNLGHNNALVVHGSGLDEIALHDSTSAIYVHNGKLEPITIHPTDFGISEQPLTAIQGDTPEYNVKAISKVFQGSGELAHTHAIAINAATLLFLHDNSTSLSSHFDTVMNSISDSSPMRTIEHAAQISQGV